MTRAYFERADQVEQDPAMRRGVQAIGTAATGGDRPGGRGARRDPVHNAVLRTGQSLTLLSGGIRSNVIPSEATATFNVRVLPDDDIRAVRRRDESHGRRASR